MKIVILLPTYNEAENIAFRLDTLFIQIGRIQHEVHILVVDESSPDGTAYIVRQKQSKHDNLHLITGDDNWLSTAYIRGMHHALQRMHADAVFLMEADFSYNPEDMHKFIAAMEEGTDFIIGSRYIRGAAVPERWSLRRYLLSWIGNVVARFATGLYHVRDCTSAFRLIRATTLNAMDFPNIKFQGSVFQVALLHEALLHNALVKEVAVSSADLRYDKSKLGYYDIVNFAIKIWAVRVRSSATYVKFCLVGMSGVFVNLAILTLLLASGINKFMASPVAIGASIITNSLLNYYWAFRRHEGSDAVYIKPLRFNVVWVLSLLVSYGSFVILAWLFTDLAPQIHQLIAIVPAVLVNYLFNAYWTIAIEKPDDAVVSTA